MSLSTTIFLVVVAALAAGAAILLGSNADLAIPLAAVSVGAAGFLLLDVLDRTLWPPSEPRARASAAPTRVRSAFEAGKYGRLELLALLDSLEPERVGPVGPPLTSEETAKLETASPEEFRRYLSARVTELEGRT